MKILIAGLPKSGTTALFFRISKSVQGPYLNLFEPTDGMAVYRREDLKGINLDQVTIISKILCTPHDLGGDNLCRLPKVHYDSFEHYDRKIFLGRDPRDNLISFMLYMIVNTTRLIEPEQATGFIDLLREKEREPESVSVLRILKFMSEANDTDFLHVFEQWQAFSDEFVERFPSYLRFRYEDLVANRLDELADFLGMQLVGEFSVPDSLGRVVRTKSSGDWQNWFTSEDMAHFSATLTPLLQSRGYVDEWTVASESALDPKFGSQYVRRIVNEHYAMQQRDERV